MERVQTRAIEGGWLTGLTGLTGLAAQARSHMYGWRRRAATIGTGLLALVMAYGVVFGHNGVIVFVQKRAEAKQLEHQKAQLLLENKRLQDHADRLENDPSAIEHEAREELHYTRSGEVIVTLPAQAKGSAAASPSAQ